LAGKITLTIFPQKTTLSVLAKGYPNFSNFCSTANTTLIQIMYFKTLLPAQLRYYLYFFTFKIISLILLLHL